ncbi:hypothetical protein [Stenotrophomonas sp. Br8]|uniref:hypothetical protein n=1 Tax=Stenotrophomonas sp. Br8 TaxID=2759658 RepID=UPI001CC7ED9C|nr:hypothetical protein [Stenotrophomonas sp. Br8]
MTTSLSIHGASAATFAGHAGYQRMFRADALTLGIFLPLRFYQGDMAVLQGQTALVPSTAMASLRSGCAMFHCSIPSSVMPDRCSIRSRISHGWLRAPIASRWRQAAW